MRTGDPPGVVSQGIGVAITTTNGAVETKHNFLDFSEWKCDHGIDITGEVEGVSILGGNFTGGNWGIYWVNNLANLRFHEQLAVTNSQLSNLLGGVHVENGVNNVLLTSNAFYNQNGPGSSATWRGVQLLESYGNSITGNTFTGQNVGIEYGIDISNKNTAAYTPSSVSGNNFSHLSGPAILATSTTVNFLFSGNTVDSIAVSPPVATGTGVSYASNTFGGRLYLAGYPGSADLVIYNNAGTLTVNSPATFASPAYFANTLYAASNVTVAGSTTANAVAATTLNLSGNFTVAGSTTANAITAAALALSGNANVNGAVSGGTLTVSANAGAGYAPAGYGTFAWNLGGTGEIDFINNTPPPYQGFAWYETPASGPPARIASLSRTGDLALTGAFSSVGSAVIGNEAVVTGAASAAVLNISGNIGAGYSAPTGIFGTLSWNLSSGAGEVSLLNNTTTGTGRGFRFYQASALGAYSPILRLDSDGSLLTTGPLSLGVCPTSPGSLPSGAVWCNGNVLTRVP